MNQHLLGNNDYLRNHPLSRQWLVKNAQSINLEIWLRGIDYACEIKQQKMRIELEKNPLEVLKMGTYVGSCYSLGGQYAHSAAAVALDINKQVLYLRDEHN